MNKYYLKNGFMIINADNAEALPEDLFDVPSMEDEEEIIKQLTQDLKNYIDECINNEIKEKMTCENKPLYTVSCVGREYKTNFKEGDRVENTGSGYK